MAHHHHIHIGAQKAGSTFLYQLLRQSPDFAWTAEKELNYFHFVEQRSYDDYLAKFDTSRRVIYENSPFYLYEGPRIAPMVAELIGDRPVSLSVGLRDPVAFLRSHYKMRVRQGTFPIDPALGRAQTLREVLETDPDYVRRGRYVEQLAPWFAAFPREKFEIFLFEEFVVDPLTVVARVFERCGAGEVDEVETRNLFTNAEPRFAFAYTMRRFFRRNPRLRAAFARVVDGPVRQAVMTVGFKTGKRRTEKSEDDLVVDRMIREAVADDVAKVKELLGRDSLPWPGFGAAAAAAAA